jgi:hypothetical protein
VVGVSDVLIREVPDATVAEIDRRARELGISRNEFLRRWLDQSIRPAATVPVTVEDLVRVGRLAGDLADPEVMRQAWS